MKMARFFLWLLPGASILLHRGFVGTECLQSPPLPASSTPGLVQKAHVEEQLQRNDISSHPRARSNIHGGSGEDGSNGNEDDDECVSPL
ncbi:hypothetical protein NCLIV_039460 [Neospora caninum Liverpool]|uniref:Secreted protein n=1 Tax=Neospora caninum (strain Liverpool) TaxID=572307 RepID=F0VB87_NEOCL|nr:hypothetical protein NCLIV_039460 [Neospora caninum Liverpool]CBZ50871.1 hypothetical protein NCLIV_039460 [Neospora caninum Liverpool]CEL68173.1 TPA: hypothetical protein BN1204_039460 [Neospora caninum Liverpool]|eukprot:XP_003880904.1 hypothetical protein NCLIV_039460 [Neospora caninum Liverpool]